MIAAPSFSSMLYRTAKAIEHEAGQSAGMERLRLLSLADTVRAEARIQARNISVEGKK